MTEEPPQPPSFRALFVSNLRILAWAGALCVIAWLIYQAYDRLF